MGSFKLFLSCQKPLKLHGDFFFLKIENALHALGSGQVQRLDMCMPVLDKTEVTDGED
jgi:hypothetical protein